MFDTHKLNEQGFAQVKIFKEAMAEVIKTVSVGIPDCREKSIFMTKMEEGMFFGTKAIAGKEGNYSEIVKY